MTPQQEYAEAKKEAHEQLDDGLITKKECEEQISWAYLKMRRRQQRGE